MKKVIVAALLVLATSYVASADQVSFTDTMYYIGPASDGADNTLGPGGTTLTNTYGDPIGTFNGAVTSAGAVETATFDTSGDPGISIGGPGQLFDIQLYGPDPTLSSPSSMLSGGVLQPGTYVFDSCSPSNYFGVEATGVTGSNAPGCNNAVLPCQSGEICNVGSSPSDVATITIGPNGVITVESGSLEIGFSPTPEMSTFLLFVTGLLGIAYALRRRAILQ